VAQPIRKCHESQVGAILILNDPSLNAVSRDKKSASMRQADGLTNFNPTRFDPDKKSASVWQPLQFVQRPALSETPVYHISVFCPVCNVVFGLILFFQSSFLLIF